MHAIGKPFGLSNDVNNHHDVAIRDWPDCMHTFRGVSIIMIVHDVCQAKWGCQLESRMSKCFVLST